MNKDIEYYMNLPYTIELIPEPEGGWFVAVKELPGCMSEGDTLEDAVEMIRDAMRGWLEISLEDGTPIPKPRIEEEYSGKFNLRVGRSLHRKLVEAAEAEGVSLNHFCSEVLAEAVGQHKRAEKLPTRYQPSIEEEKRAPKRVIAEREEDDYSKTQ
jgi:antitoxin HicB